MNAFNKIERPEHIEPFSDDSCLKQSELAQALQEMSFEDFVKLMVAASKTP